MSTTLTPSTPRGRRLRVLVLRGVLRIAWTPDQGDQGPAARAQPRAAGRIVPAVTPRSHSAHGTRVNRLSTVSFRGSGLPCRLSTPALTTLPRRRTRASAPDYARHSGLCWHSWPTWSPASSRSTRPRSSRRCSMQTPSSRRNSVTRWATSMRPPGAGPGQVEQRMGLRAANRDKGLLSPRQDPRPLPQALRGAQGLHIRPGDCGAAHSSGHIRPPAIPELWVAWIDNSAGEAALKKGYGKDMAVNGVLAAGRWRPE